MPRLSPPSALNERVARGKLRGDARGADEPADDERAIPYRDPGTHQLRDQTRLCLNINRLGRRHHLTPAVQGATICHDTTQPERAAAPSACRSAVILCGQSLHDGINRNRQRAFDGNFDPNDRDRSSQQHQCNLQRRGRIACGCRSTQAALSTERRRPSRSPSSARCGRQHDHRARVYVTRDRRRAHCESRRLRWLGRDAPVAEFAQRADIRNHVGATTAPRSDPTITASATGLTSGQGY